MKSESLEMQQPLKRASSKRVKLSDAPSQIIPAQKSSPKTSKMVCFSEDTKDDINLDLLDDVAWCQIQRLTRLMDYLSSKVKVIIGDE